MQFSLIAHSMALHCSVNGSVSNHVKNLIFLSLFLFVFANNQNIKMDVKKKCSTKCKEFESTSFSLFQWSLQIASNKSKAKYFLEKESTKFSERICLSEFLGLVNPRHERGSFNQCIAQVFQCWLWYERREKFYLSQCLLFIIISHILCSIFWRDEFERFEDVRNV